MVFWKRNSNEEEEKEPLHQKIQTQFSNIVDRIGNSLTPWKVNHALSTAEIKSRMAGIPVYKLATYDNGDAGVLAREDPTRRVELHFFSKPDALDFFDRMKLLDDWPTDDHWRVFDAPLTNVLGSEAPIRLVPESLQIKNAFEEKKKNMAGDDNFNINISGVPVFKSDAVRMEIISRGNAGFCPVFLRKEDLQDTVTALDILPGDIEVASLEEIIQEMKDGSTNKSNDLVFIGPGASTFWL